MPTQRDIPGQIARWLFGFGIVWAVILVPLTILLFLPFFLGKSFWQLGIYFLIGFAVWIGWGWRSRKRPGQLIAAAFWLCSAAFNSAFLVYLIVIGHQWSNLFFDQTGFFAWWWMAATLASLVALVLEFTLKRDEPHAA